MQAALDYARAHREHFTTQLIEFLRIPSISTLPEHSADIRRAAGWVADQLRRIGMEHVEIYETAHHPIIYADWLHAGPDVDTVLVYAHYDVQPVDPLDQWISPPFEPSIRDGQIYARGSVDDKCQLALHLNVLEALLMAEGKLPINVKVAFEGEEEVGSQSLDQFILTHRDLLSADSVLISDTSFMSATLPSMPYSVRGIAAAEIHIYGPKHDLHSGGYGGTVHNPASALAKIIATLHDDDGHILVPGFYDQVRALSIEERQALTAAAFPLEHWQQETGLTKPWGEPEFTLRERIGLRPTCEVNGMWSGFQGEGSKTIIPSEAHAKITMRLVADQDPDTIVELFQHYIESIAPHDLRVEVQQHPDQCWPASTPIDAREIKAASAVLAQGWGADPVLVPGGGSLPIVATMRRELGVPVIMMGFGLPDSGLHAPNEHFSLSQFEKGTEAVIRYYYQLAES
jgi:acetylornithine deacetylase/succinyl-diaminopimelate desuccinylase-like protein